ncbi:PD-(D/E)XK nuclease family protein [Chrysiogenes arsenatis]|uniref:PD-(D/E)XK nuclease family protein n=1 Tax=Chrysiogenes arsenatis TaxID=309797 RepID=UPI00041772B0|nr:PD-(D/E)XK nuclease family protein [Chrysiogenes arsenatis]
MTNVPQNTLPNPPPRVTEILAPWTDFSMIRESVLEAACERGTAVHDICAAIAMGFPPKSIPAELAGYVRSFRQWFDTAVQTIHAVEERMIDDALQFSGQPDLIATLYGDECKTVIDYKTAVSQSRTWPLQLAAYSHLAVRNYQTERHLVVQLNREGRPARVTEYHQQPRHMAAFMNALALHHYFNPIKGALHV